MTHNTHNWNTTDGLNIFAQSWTVENPKALICVVHGMGEHGARHINLANHFTAQGYSVLAIDHRGHGKSEGQRGHSPNFEALLSDIDQMLAYAQQLFPNVPIVLYGHSMGGGVVLNYGISRKNPPIKGIVASAPWLRTAFAPSPIKVGLAKLVGGLLPALSQPTGLDATAISRDEAVVKAYIADPLVHDKITPGFFLGASAAGEYAIAHAGELSVPTLVYHGDEDRLTSREASEEFVANSKGKAEFKLWPTYFHELHNDPGKEQVFAHVQQWIEKL